MLTSERVTLRDMAEFLGDRSIGGLLLILALPMALPMPAPGISVLFGVPLIVISGPLALGYRRAWLPARLAQRTNLLLLAVSAGGLIAGIAVWLSREPK